MKKRKILLTTMLTILALTLLATTNVQAALQSVPTTTGTKQDTPDNWVINIRKMENAGGGMGLKETINETTGLAISESNNIDVHLLKNTEYGAIVLLGASDYGKQGTDINLRRMDWGETTGTGVQASTTGNKYGVYEIGYKDMSTYKNFKDTSVNTTARPNYEWTAAGGPNFLSNIAPRYIDRYSYYNEKNQYADVLGKADTKAGDATIETAGWHATERLFFWLSRADRGFLRGYTNDGIGAFGTEGRSDFYGYDGRAAVVCGAGL